jgi:argininosuccinate lyase
MKPWGGRFRDGTDPLMERFSASIRFDRALYRYDIEGSKAHAEMLGRIGILTGKEREAIVSGLEEIRQEIEAGNFVYSNALEDIHMHIESRLIEKTGDAGRKLHTGRSRNDQVSLDMRMFLKEELTNIEGRLTGLQRGLVEKAGQEKMSIMAGYTHMQKAQVVTFAHYLMAYYYMLKRDGDRMRTAKQRLDVLPLGSGALAGSTIPLDREFVREKLGFARISENSMDAVSDRDFVLDAMFSGVTLMIHLSRFAEDMILFSTEEFSYISLPDELCTGSSLMPHKKNPDSLELIRGKTARVIGDLTGMLTLLKGLPLTYNRDLQEDKELLFHTIDTVKDGIDIAGLCVKGMSVNRKRMEEAAYRSFMPAVEMAEYLTLKGMPFREAHGVVGRLVRWCEEENKSLKDLTLADLQAHSGLFGDDVFGYIDPRNILANRKTAGGASFDEIDREIDGETKYLNT